MLQSCLFCQHTFALSNYEQKFLIMKTTMKSIILGATLFITSSSIALATEPTVTVTGNEAFELKLTGIYENTQITLTNKSGNTLFEDAISGKTEYLKKFKVNQLPAGTYYIKIEDSRSVMTLPLEFSGNQLSFNESSMVERFKPVVMQKGSILYVNYFTPEKSSLDVSIYNNKGELVYSETLAGKMAQGKGYDFSKSPKGEYTIALASEGEFYSKTVKLDQ